MYSYLFEINFGLSVLLMIFIIIQFYEKSLLIVENENLRKNFKEYKKKMFKTIKILDSELKMINKSLQNSIKRPIVSTIDFSSMY
jgi:hypothetical protein